MKKYDYTSSIQTDNNCIIHLLMIDDKPFGFIPQREGYFYDAYELVETAKKQIIERLCAIPDYIKKLGQDRPRKEKNETQFSNAELRAILANVPNERKEEVATIFKKHQKDNARHKEIPENELFEFGVKLLNKLDAFVEQNGFRDFVDCFSLCGTRYNLLYKNSAEKNQLVRSRIAKSKNNFYSDLAGNFAIVDYYLDSYLDSKKIGFVCVPLISNKELFEREYINCPIYDENENNEDENDEDENEDDEVI